MAEGGPRGIILDFDGVIVESVDIKTRAFRELFAGYPEHVERIVAFHEANAGVSRYEKFRVIFREFLHEPCDEARMRGLGSRFSELVMDAVIRCPFVRGAEAFLKEFGARYALFLASGTPQNELREVAHRRGLTAHFHEIHGAPRTKVEIIRGILETHRWEPADVVVIGDSLTDYHAAQSLRIPFIGRRTAHHPSLFAEVGPLRTVEDLAELAQQWDQWAGELSVSSSGSTR
jgi:phosphoglycolate phosphatase-like HAD superfamily hydrolase